MPTDYNLDRTAEEFQAATSHAWRSRIEEYSLRKLIGDVRGKKVLDVACGEGRYARLLRRAGASPVVGSDISDRMIGLARDQEMSDPLGIEYLVEDATSLVPQQDFDLVVAAFLLVYARDRTELARMCAALARRVRPGGRFVAIAVNPGIYSVRPVPDYRKYGFDVRLADHPYEGAPINFTLFGDGARTEIENYYLPLEAYESALRDAGFRDVGVHLPELSPGPDTDTDYWRDLLENPILIFLDCVMSSPVHGRT